MIRLYCLSATISTLGIVSMSRSSSNPYLYQLTHPPYIRLIENNWPYAMLLEVMRMTHGLEVLYSVLFYEGELESYISRRT